MEQIKLNNELSISRLVQGVWRLADWDYSNKLVEELVEGCLELGIDTFDHADIYGDYACEELFGKALPSSLKQKLKIVTKCGIKLVSDKRPDHYVKHYDTSFEHIVWSAENSLKAMGIEAIDVLLIHRPDPFMNPNEVARAFSQLKAQGKVKHFGVSNFLPSQFKALQAALDFKLVTNQIEISAISLHEFDNGSIDLCQELNMHPMAWSPLGGGSIFNAQTHRMMTLKNVLHKIGDNHGATIDQVMYAWLLAHPAGIIPVIGSGKLARIKAAADAVEIKLSRQEWFEIWVASKGQSVP
jgi:predicted oxidoreductase